MYCPAPPRARIMLHLYLHPHLHLHLRVRVRMRARARARVHMRVRVYILVVVINTAPSQILHTSCTHTNKHTNNRSTTQGFSMSLMPFSTATHTRWA